jgi:pimeloyl-ACP methyl ester carboxylesterase
MLKKVIAQFTLLFFCFANGSYGAEDNLAWMSLLLGGPQPQTVEVFLEGSDNNKFDLLSGDSLQTGPAQVLFVDPLEDPATFTLMSGPDGLYINSTDGAVLFTAPSVSVAQKYDFQFKVTSSTGKSSFFSGEIRVFPISESQSTIATSSATELILNNFRVSAEAGEIFPGTEIIMNEGFNDNGDQILLIIFSDELPETSTVSIDLDFNLPDASTRMGSTTSATNGDECPAYAPHPFHTTKEYFDDKGRRVPLGTTVIRISKDDFRDLSRTYKLKKKTASVACSPTTVLSSDIQDYTPVLFVHGFTYGDILGGGEKTWGKMFSELSTRMMPKKILPVEFRWRTNARYEDAAADLVEISQKLHDTTTNSIHFVAHSFGGLLVRTFLQGLAAEYGTYNTYAASLTTVGTPHSGIYDDETADHARGLDSGVISTKICGQISCYQAGEYVGYKHNEIDFLKLTKGFGSIIIDLNNNANQFVPDRLPVQTLIGLRTTVIGGARKGWTGGDGLISLEGQRFLRSDRQSLPLRKEHLVSSLGAVVSERYIERPNETSASLPWTECSNCFGFGHTKYYTKSLYTKYKEVEVENSQHKTLLSIASWLDEHISTTTPQPNTHSYTFSGTLDAAHGNVPFSTGDTFNCSIVYENTPPSQFAVLQQFDCVIKHGSNTYPTIRRSNFSPLNTDPYLNMHFPPSFIQIQAVNQQVGGGSYAGYGMTSMEAMVDSYNSNYSFRIIFDDWPDYVYGTITGGSLLGAVL